MIWLWLAQFWETLENVGVYIGGFLAVFIVVGLAMVVGSFLRWQDHNDD